MSAGAGEQQDCATPVDGADQCCRLLQIRNRRGLHARASAKFVSTVSGFDADVRVSKDDIEVSGKSIMGLMMLTAALGDRIRVTAQGVEAIAAMNAVEKLIEDRFGED